MVADDTMAFHFEKPAGFDFKPGQAIDLTLEGSAGQLPGGEDLKHAFSIVSAPHQEELVIATRMRNSAFKRALGALPADGSAAVDGPFGSLTLHKKPDRGAVLIAGGIGVTPFMSMLRHATHERSPRELRLLYTNHRPEDAAFLTELRDLERQNPRFTLVATMTRMEQSTLAWEGPVERIDGELIRQAAGAMAHPAFYLAGPPAMVEAVLQTLSSAGVDEDDVRSETFFGY
ncbi:ferredoxin--NADP reductase [Dyella psychrodurans]|nr:FAD-dependent oxidoreductase [Dyella psychrodurans]